jgi:hypothetical protein
MLWCCVDRLGFERIQKELQLIKRMGCIHQVVQLVIVVVVDMVDFEVADNVVVVVEVVEGGKVVAEVVLDMVVVVVVVVVVVDSVERSLELVVAGHTVAVVVSVEMREQLLW